MTDSLRDSSSIPSMTSAREPHSQHHEDLILDAPSGKAGIVDGLKSLQFRDFRKVSEVPCAREALLFGIGVGFGIGGLHFVVRGNAWRSMNWFVGSWAAGSVGAYQFCHRRRELERKGIGRAVEIMERKKKEKEGEMRKAREEVNKRREEAERRERERQSQWGDWRRFFRPGDAQADEERRKWEETRK